MLLLALLACRPDVKDTAPPPVVTEAPARCGDGVVDDDEECDDGAENGDAPDACRATCLLPTCGDTVVDSGEGCDDGAWTGGDGCDGACAVETGSLEVEENDDPALATVASGRVHGSLPDGDTDCYAFEVARCEAVRVSQVGPCTTALTMALYDPDGAQLAAGAPGADGCAVLDPADQPGARWVRDGTWTVCVEAVQGELASYALDIGTEDASALTANKGTDLDDDGEPDSCDLDRDGDGVGDTEDTCLEVSNGPATTLALSSDGYVRTWISAGPFTGDEHSGECRPSEVARVGEDGEFAPMVGDAAGDQTWIPDILTSDSLDLTDRYAYVSAPREAYALVYLWSDTARPATLSVGADDGVFAWWNGTLAMDISSCQGVNRDQFQAPVDIVSGWNTLLLKVYDQGGGWGLVARLLDAGGTPLTDLTPALDPAGTWRPDQTDTDGDGLGDVCDE